MKYFLHCLLLITTVLLLSNCSSEPETGAGKMHWDREICARCAMAVSDRQFAVQVRGAVAEKPTKLYKFDDIGCAILWLEQQEWENDPRTEMWIIDHLTNKWIDAMKAHYVPADNTPMDYGLAAQLNPTDNSINYQQAIKHIKEVDKGEHRHSKHKGMMK